MSSSSRTTRAPASRAPSTRGTRSNATPPATPASPPPPALPAVTPRITVLPSGVRVMCLFDELVDYRTLVRFPRNPNKHPKAQIKALTKIIVGTGWRNPIVVSTRSGHITKGHGRLDSAGEIHKQRGETMVPVEYQHYDSEAQEFADIVADNKIAELSELDDSIVGSLMLDVRGTAPDFDFEMFGFGMDRVADFFADPGAGDEEGGRYTAEDLQRFAAYFANGQQITQSPERESVWRVGDHFLYCGSVLYGHTAYLPLLAQLQEEFPNRRIALVPVPEPMMLGTRSKKVAALFIQPDITAAALTLSFVEQCYPSIAFSQVGEAEE